MIKKHISVKTAYRQVLKKCWDEGRGSCQQFLKIILICLKTEKENSQRKGKSDKKDVFKDPKKVQNTKLKNAIKSYVNRMIFAFPTMSSMQTGF